MSYLIHFLCLCCFLTTVIECQLLVVREPSIENDQLKNLLLAGSNVLVGSETILYQLNSESLTTINKLNISGVNRLLLQLEIEGDFDVLACQSSSCLLVNSSNVMQKKRVNNPSNYPDAEETLVSVNTNEDADPLVGIVAGNNSFFAAREDLNTLATDIASSVSRISYNDTTDELQLSLIGQQEEGSLFIQRIFRTVFKNDEFVYFVFELNLDRSARFAQLCLTDPGTGSSINDGTLTTYTEVELQCGSDVFPSSATEITIDGQLMVLVSMHPVEGSSTQSQICIFNVSEISTIMNDALQQCANVVDNDPPSIFINNLARQSSGIPVPCQDVNGIVTPCSRGGVTRLPLGINTPVTGRSVLTSTNSLQFSSLVSFSYEGITYVFAGTGTNVDQYYYTNDALQFIRSVNVSSSDATVDEIHLSSDYEYFYALTTSSVSRYPVNVCDQYTDCTSCVESLDPLCGWCTLTSTCTKLTDCTTTPPVWETTDGGCPRITNVQPDFIFTNELEEVGVNFTLTYKNIPNVTYECAYTFSNDSLVTTSAKIISNDTLECSPPPMNSLPPFGEENTLSALLSLQTVPSMATIISYSDVEFTNCSTQKSCFTCLTSAGRCQWCPVSLKCISSDECDGVNEVSFNGSVPEDHCPFFSPPRRTENYLVHNGQEGGLVISAQNLLNFEPTCVITSDDGLINYTIPATDRNATHVVCGGVQFDVNLTVSNPVIEAQLSVLVNGVPIKNAKNTKVVFYSCLLLGANCGQCLSISNDFDCVHCQDIDKCVISSVCTSTKLRFIEDFKSCDPPRITSISPTAGPPQGDTTIVIKGENLGADVSQVQNISIGEDGQCDQIVSAYIPGLSISCVTREITKALIEDKVTVTFKLEENGVLSRTESTSRFAFRVPDLHGVNPPIGPLAGGTRVVVSGDNIGIGSSRSITLGGQPCHILNEHNISVNANNFTCITSSSESTTVRNQGVVFLKIDDFTETKVGFDYDQNPSFSSIRPEFSFQSGGTSFTVEGNDLDTVQEPRLLFYKLKNTPSSGNETQKRDVESQESEFDFDNPIRSDPCNVIGDSEMTCSAPRLDTNDAVVSIGLEMDSVTSLLVLNQSINVFEDPVFDGGQEFEVEPGQTRNLTLPGKQFKFLADQIVIKILVPGRDVTCTTKEVTLERVICEFEVSTDIAEGMYDIEVNIGQYRRDVGSVSIRKVTDLFLPIFISCLAGFVVLVVVIFIVFFSIFYHKYKQKDQQNDFLLFELDRLESNMAHECKLGFAELQTDVDELTGDLSGSRLPFHDFHVYLLQSLFPGSTDHPMLHDLQLQPQRKAQTERALKDFHQIILNKAALMAIIQALEKERAFTIRDKSNMGSLLMLALHDRLDYATVILKALLSALVKKTVAESYPKLLLRRTESVAEKMLSSWLAFTLHGYVMEHTGQPLYRLFKAVKAQLEKGPVDVVTGEARYSLSEQKLIRQQIDVTFINATVETDEGMSVPVKLLDCDSISQAKEKILDAVYKNSPVSQRPALTDIDIEYRRVPKEDGYLLRDEDGSNEADNGWRKINTLTHYWIPDRAVFRMVPRKDHPPPGRVYDYTGSLMVTHGYRNRSASDAEDGWRVWHLFKQHEEDPRSSPFISKKLVTEIYLPRMLSTKTILQTFVDNLFKSIFTMSQPPLSPSQLYTPINATFSPLTTDGYAPGTDSLPVPIKYLFDFLDDEAASLKISDPDVLHTWKNNSLALRFWVNLIKNPEFVFDINKSAIVDSCLSVIAQAFIDGCSSSDAKPTINSPTSKLLFNKEVQGYKTSVKQYYEQIAELPRIPEEMMDTYLKNLSSHQTQLLGKSGNFHTVSALNEIMRYCIKYKDPILDALRDSGLDAEAVSLDSAIQRSM